MPKNDYRPFEIIEVSPDEIVTSVASERKKMCTNSSWNTNFSRYSSDVMYLQMSAKEKALYNTMYLTCEKYLTSEEDLINSEIKGKTYYLTSEIHYSNIKSEDAYNVALIFSIENPQFYFIDNAIVTTKNDNLSGILQFDCFEDFRDGTERKRHTTAFFSATDNIINEISTLNTTFAKEKAIHDYICNTCTYKTNKYDQSSYSAIILKESVCAGYTEAFALLCNGAGIDTISVTSNEHEWNEIYVDGWWYTVDNTWDDQDYGTIYDFFNKSDNSLLSFSKKSKEYHTVNDFWDEHNRPLCLYDYGEEEGEPQNRVFTTNMNEINMYRLYNTYTGEHFYTGNAVERDTLMRAGWNFEGLAWMSPAISSTPVYRLYNPYAIGGEHFYTINVAEKEHLVSLGWIDEGIGWYSDDNKTTPVYRQYNHNTTANGHNYTVIKQENDHLVSIGWIDEGVAWYGC